MTLGGAIMTIVGHLLLIVLGVLLVFFVIAAIPAGLTIWGMDLHDKAKATQRANRIQLYRDGMPKLETELMEKFRKSVLVDEIVDFIITAGGVPTSVHVNEDEIVISHGNMYGNATIFRFEDHNIKPITDERIMPSDRYGTKLSNVGMDYNGISECDALGGVLMERLADHYSEYTVSIGESAMQRGQTISSYFTITKPVIKKEPERSF